MRIAERRREDSINIIGYNIDSTMYESDARLRDVARDTMRVTRMRRVWFKWKEDGQKVEDEKIREWRKGEQSRKSEKKKNPKRTADESDGRRRRTREDNPRPAGMSEIGRNGTRGNESDCVHASQRVHFRFAREREREAHEGTRFRRSQREKEYGKLYGGRYVSRQRCGERA